MMKTLHETHPVQFGIKYLVQYIWWPHINRQIYFHGINCLECTITGKNLKSLIPNSQITELPPPPSLLEPNEKLNLDFAGPLDSYWGVKQIHFTLHRPILKISIGKSYLFYLFKNSYRISTGLYILTWHSLFY